MNATPAAPLTQLARIRPLLAHRAAQLIPWVLLLITLSITFLIWQQQTQIQQSGAQARLDREMERASSGITARMSNYEGLLIGLRGLFSANGAISRERWRTYADSLRLAELYPAISGVGFVARVPANMRQVFQVNAHAEGLTDYAVKPDGERQLYYPIQYIEPLENNADQLGYDIASNPALNAAAEQARDSGRPVITAQVFQGEQAYGQPRFMMFLPVYRRDLPQSDAEERRAALVGWIYAPFRGSELVTGVLGSDASQFELLVFDGKSTAPADLLYDAVWREPSLPAPILTATSTLPVSNHVWTLKLNTLPAFHATDSNQPLFVLVGGVLLSLMLFALGLTLANMRANAVAIADRMTKELRESEQRFRLITENAADLIAVVDTTGRRLYNSPSYKTILGYSPDELRGTWAFGEIASADRPRVEGAAQETLATGKGQLLEYQMRHKDGSLRTLESTSSPIYNAKGEVDSLIIVARDITLRKEAEETRRREEALRQQNEYLAALHETTLALVRHLDLTELLQAIVTRAGALVGTEHGYVYLREPGEDVITMRVGVGAYGGFIGAHAQPGVGLAGQVWQTGEPLVVDDYRTWKDRLASSSRDILRAVVGVPLKSGSEVRGVIGLAFLEEGHKFGPAELDLLDRFAHLAAVALDNANLFKQTQDALTEAEALYEASQRISSATTLEEIARGAAQITLSLDMFYCSLTIFDQASPDGIPTSATRYAFRFANDEEIALHPHPGPAAAEWMPSGHDFYREFYRQQSILLYPDIEDTRTELTESGRAYLASLGARSMLTLWLRARGKPLGYLTFFGEDPLRRPAEFYIQRASSIADQVATVLDNLQLLQQTQKALSETENLYGISTELNKARMFSDIVVALSKYPLFSQPTMVVSLALFDRPWTGQQKPEWVELVGRPNGVHSSAARPRFRLDSAIAPVFRQGVPTVIDDLANDPRLKEMRLSLLSLGLVGESAVLVPMVVGGQWIGYVNVLYRERTDLTEDELRRVMAVVSQAAIAAQNLQQLAENQSRAQRELLTREIVTQISHSIDQTTILRTTARQLGHALGASHLVIRLNPSASPGPDGNGHHQESTTEVKNSTLLS